MKLYSIGETPDFLGGNTIESHLRLKAFAKEFLHENRYTEIAVLLNKGWGLALAEAATELRREVHVLLPAPGIEEDWKPFYKTSLNTILKQSTVHHYQDAKVQSFQESITLLEKSAETLINSNNGSTFAYLWSGQRNLTFRALKPLFKYTFETNLRQYNLWEAWSKFVPVRV